MKVIDGHEWGPVIGEGAWGKVRQCRHVATGEDRAVKIMYRCKLERKIKEGIERLRKEFQLVRSLNHPSIVRYYELDEISRPDKIYLFMELCGVDILSRAPLRTSHTQLRLYIQDKFKQLLAGLCYLHHQGVAHHDIKPDNILISSDGVVKVCDFGVAEKIDQTKDEGWHCFYGTPAYQPPEVVGNITGNAFDGPAADVWSIGVILFQLVKLQIEETDEDQSIQWSLPFHGETVYLLYKSIERDPVPFPPNLAKEDPWLDDLLRKLLEKDPNKRITCAQALNHPFFQNQAHPSGQGCCSIC